MSARDRILTKLRHAMPAENRQAPDVAAWFASHRPQEDSAAKAARFRHFIELAHAEVHAVTPGNWLQVLQGVLATKEIRRLLLAPSTAHGAQAMAQLMAGGIDCRAYDRAIEHWKAEMFHDIPASLTTARAAVAETGTLILWPDGNEPRLMSLVPPIHIVLLDSARIYNTFFEATEVEAWKYGLPTNAVLVSGPSKTADIQVTLAYGAHGPKELVVLLMGDGK